MTPVGCDFVGYCGGAGCDQRLALTAEPRSQKTPLGFMWFYWTGPFTITISYPVAPLTSSFNAVAMPLRPNVQPSPSAMWVPRSEDCVAKLQRLFLPTKQFCKFFFNKEKTTYIIDWFLSS